MNNQAPVYAIIMAGGQGKRINAKDLPKVLYPISGRPMLSYVYDAIKSVADEVVIVTGFQGKKVEAAMKGKPVKFAHQAEQLGTAHAVQQAEKILKGRDGMILVTNGDHPLFSRETFAGLIDYFEENQFDLVLVSATEDDHPAFGRVLRNKRKVIGVREAKDATPAELKIREKNAGIYLIRSLWLWKALKKIKKSKVTGEYYITDLIEIAIAENKKVGAFPLKDPREIKGINTLAELKEVEQIMAETIKGGS